MLISHQFNLYTVSTRFQVSTGSQLIWATLLLSLLNRGTLILEYSLFSSPNSAPAVFITQTRSKSFLQLENSRYPICVLFHFFFWFFWNIVAGMRKHNQSGHQNQQKKRRSGCCYAVSSAFRGVGRCMFVSCYPVVRCFGLDDCRHQHHHHKHFH
ncbi:hypothetical protein OWV82_008100 [Melia azedarach]|uniref:Uncharacterized protein n=1 Tax=Melia azedarach TaxID=155640 RepID=A0ACC1YAE8_MELAZ|nr:hypothetical protein OWV82_008100 [Melia azedarach]